MKFEKLFLLAISTLLFTQNCIARTRDSISMEIGTLGSGLSYARKMPFFQSSTSNLNFRIGLIESPAIRDSVVNTDTDKKGTNDETSSTVLSNFKSIYYLFLVDWHPYNTEFRVTAGIVKSDAAFTTVTNKIGKKISIGGIATNSNNKVNMTSRVIQDAINLYMGIGYGQDMKIMRGVRFNASLGFIVQNDPTATVSASIDGTKITDEARLKAEEKLLVKNISKTKNGKSLGLSILPHISIGFEVRF